MTDFILEHYDWFRALHIIAVMAWMAGMLYLPRLFVYHADAEKGSDLDTTFQTMERRLLKYIMNPAMGASWLLGGLMLWANADIVMAQGWMHAKLLLIILMTGAHHAFGAWRKKFERGENTKSAKFYKIMNEIPTVILIAIVVLAVVEPF